MTLSVSDGLFTDKNDLDQNYLPRDSSDDISTDSSFPKRSGEVTNWERTKRGKNKLFLFLQFLFYAQPNALHKMMSIIDDVTSQNIVGKITSYKCTYTECCQGNLHCFILVLV